jgi:phosphoglycerol transferase MdoB-like AlkP superfamily enzyme
MNWFEKNFKKLIYGAFLVPIITVAIVSISHVTKWYGISNPLSWAIYLSIGIEIAALSALAAIAAKMGKKVYFPFIIVTLIQFIGNIFFAYQYIDIGSQAFKDWVDLVDPLVSFMGVESGDFVAHKRFLSFFAGGMLPIISLSFLHMLVKFEEEEKTNKVLEVNIEELSKQVGKMEAEVEEKRYVPSQEELDKLNEELNKIQKIQETESEEVRNKRRLSYLKRDAQT